MGKYASKVVAQAKVWLGKKESDGSFKEIIDTYNKHKPLARGYAVKYTDNWCATFVSAVAIKLGYTDIIPTECGCEKMIELFKAGGNWVEDESATPGIGWFLFYDWQDNGIGDNKGWSEHVGIIESVVNGIITVIEGNYSESVKRRTLSVNSKYIRGYGVPKYDKEQKTEKKYTMEPLKKGSTGNDVTIFESIMKKMGYYKGKIDESFGDMCVAACNEFQKKYPECGSNGKPDGHFGAKSWAKALSLIN